MLVYPSFIYLQNQKTGSTLVETCLREFCAEPLERAEKHAALSAPPGRFCFTNVREPLALYRSLFAYGLDGRGAVFERLSRKGQGALYARGPAGFGDWLSFVLKPANAAYLADAYTPEVARRLGFMGWRFLRLACPGFETRAPGLETEAAFRAFVTKANVLNAVLRQEALARDLGALVTGPLAAAFPDQAGVTAWLAKAPKVNASQSLRGIERLDARLVARVLRREAFLYGRFYARTAALYTDRIAQARPAGDAA